MLKTFPQLLKTGINASRHGLQQLVKAKPARTVLSLALRATPLVSSRVLPAHQMPALSAMGRGNISFHSSSLLPAFLRPSHLFVPPLHQVEQQAQKEKPTALAMLHRRFSLMVGATQLFSRARLEDKDSIFQRFMDLNYLFSPQLVRAAPLYYSLPLYDLTDRVRNRSIVLAQQEEFIKQQVLTIATEKQLGVEHIAINERLLSIAPKPVQDTMHQLMAALTESQLEQLSITESDKQMALVVYGDSSVGRATESPTLLEDVFELSAKQQQQLLKALLRGTYEASNEQLALNPSEQIALTAIAINKLGEIANVSQSDLNALNQFTRTLVSNLESAEEGKKLFISLMVDVVNAFGENEYHSIHIDLNEFVKNPASMISNLGLALLKLGVNSSTPLVISLTSAQQVNALSALQAQRDNLAVEANRIEEAMALALLNPAQFTSTVNEDELALTLVSPSRFGTENALTQEQALTALVCVSQSLSSTFDHNTQQQLGFSDYIGHNPWLPLSAHEEALVLTQKAIAEEVQQEVEQMPVIKRVISLAQDPIKNTLTQLIAFMSEDQLSQLVFDDTDKQTALVLYQEQSTERSPEQINLIDSVLELTAQKQQQLINTLFMGHQATSELVALSPEGQIACIAIALNKLARVANVPSTDLNAINQFTYDVLSTLSPVAQGKKTYIMIGINLANADSVPAYSTIYIDLDEFIKSPQQMMANLNEALVEMGINSLTSVTISLTSQPLMSSLVGSEERMMLASSNLEDSSALIVSPPLSWVPGHFYEKEVSLTPIQPVNVENALEVITRLKVNIARIFTHHQNGQYFEASDSVGSPLLYILADDDEEEEELRNNVPLIRTSSQEDLEQEQEIEMRQNKPQLFSPLVGLDSKEKPIAPSTAELVFESPMPESQQVLQPGTPQDQALTLADGVNGVAFDPSNSVSLEEQSVAIVAIRTSGLESGVAPTSDFAETTVGMMGYTGVAREVHSPGPSITPLVNGDLIRQFKLGVDRLEQLNKVLMEKYCYDQEKRYIIITNQLLIEELNTALNNYEKPGTALRGDLKQFKTACLKAVNDKVKEQYNRHRDGPIGQFFGFIAEALSNFWAQLFSSAEECQKRTEVQAEEHRFFGTEAMVTRSAKALNLFNMEMTAAFKLVQADDDLEDRAQLGVVE